MIIDKEHLKEGGRLIARQGAAKSGCIRRLMCNGLFKTDSQLKSVFKS